MDELYRNYYANIHRGVYTIAEEATASYEAARAKVARFVGATRASEIVFVRNATEAINLVAYSWARHNLHEGDVIVLTAHGAPRQRRAVAHPRGRTRRRAALGAAHRRLPARHSPTSTSCSTAPSSSRSPRCRTCWARSTTSAALADAAHAAGALALVDACQAVPHLPVDVAAWDADFVAFSSHKMCGPTGIGALWARAELLEAMPPFLGGGEMISNVTVDGFTPNEVPWKFEAGTMPIAEAVGFGAAVDYLDDLGMDSVRAHEKQLTAYTLGVLDRRFGDNLTIYGPLDVDVRGGAISFLFDGIHAHDISQVVDEEAVCVRAGHHCAKPLMRVLGVPATTRASFYVYNDEADADALVDALARAEKFFAI